MGRRGGGEQGSLAQDIRAQAGKGGSPGRGSLMSGVRALSRREGRQCGVGVSTKKNQYFLGKGLIPRLSLGKYKMSLEHLVPKNKKMFKE